MEPARRTVAGREVWVWPGAAPCWLVLHGFTGAPASWRFVAEAVGGCASMVAPALPGHDGTAAWGWQDTFSGVVDELAAIALSLGGGPWRVAGYSMGGRLALALLAAYPGRFAGAVVIGASSGLADPGERAARRESDGRWAELLRRSGVTAFLAAWEEQPLFASQRALAPALLAEQRELRQRHRPEGLARALEVLGLGAMPDLAPALTRVSCPVTLMAGEEDGKFAALAATMAAGMPAASVRIVPGCGHNVILERPDVVAGLLVAATGDDPEGPQ